MKFEGVFVEVSSWICLEEYSLDLVLLRFIQPFNTYLVYLIQQEPLYFSFGYSCELAELLDCHKPFFWFA